MLNNGVLVVISHPEIANMLSVGLYCHLELGICKPSAVEPVGADPGTVGGLQALIELLVSNYVLI